MSAFVDRLPARLAAFGPIKLRAMFGGHGVYFEGLMFGLVADDALWLKADAESKPQYEKAGWPPFIYDRKGKPVALSYHRVPASALGNPGQVLHWCGVAYESAQRAQRARRSTRRPKPRRPRI